MTKTTIGTVIAFIVLVVLGWMVLGSHKADTLVGAVTNQCASGQTCLPSMELTGPVGSVLNALQVDAGTFQLGATGNSLSLIQKGTCTILADASVAATSTKNFDCAFAGVNAGDTVFVTEQASSTLASQFVIKGATASSTTGFITFSILNLTGTAAVPSATNGFGSSTQVLILR